MRDADANDVERGREFHGWKNSDFDETRAAVRMIEEEGDSIDGLSPLRKAEVARLAYSNINILYDESDNPPLDRCQARIEKALKWLGSDFTDVQLLRVR